MQAVCRQTEWLDRYCRLIYGLLFLLVRVVFSRTVVFVRCLGGPALAGFPRDRPGNLPSIVHAIASVAAQLWDDGRWTGHEEVH